MPDKLTLACYADADNGMEISVTDNNPELTRIQSKSMRRNSWSDVDSVNNIVILLDEESERALFIWLGKKLHGA